MALYRVAQGHTWGVNKSPAESVVELNPEEADPFVPWKLVPVEMENKVTPDKSGPIFTDEQLRELGVEMNESGIISQTASDPLPEDWDEELSDRVIDLLEDADLVPEQLSEMPDEDILKISGIGPTFLREIRVVYPSDSVKE